MVVLVLVAVVVGLLGYIVYGKQKNTNTDTSTASAAAPIPAVTNNPNSSPSPTPQPSIADDRIRNDLGFSYRNAENLSVTFWAEDAETYRPHLINTDKKVYYDKDAVDWIYEDIPAQQSVAGQSAGFGVLNQSPTKIWSLPSDGYYCTVEIIAFYRSGKIILGRMPPVCGADYLQKATAEEKASSLVSGSETDAKFKAFYSSIAVE